MEYGLMMKDNKQAFQTVFALEQPQEECRAFNLNRHK
jgi:hypothetical protein